ncbi:hypothetical protein TNCT_545781 [Trichonephila clavata]|uniref:Uncharacterized protein n=1 Tax=Trichonephila clavata TaxID=2740835 RepID=A0A8X6HBK3_TRICU|nr:hypothetical protein TNCT_545781 [Trichonephila clavata]
MENGWQKTGYFSRDGAESVTIAPSLLFVPMRGNPAIFRTSARFVNLNEIIPGALAKRSEELYGYIVFFLFFPLFRLLFFVSDSDGGVLIGSHGNGLYPHMTPSAGRRHKEGGDEEKA